MLKLITSFFILSFTLIGANPMSYPDHPLNRFTDTVGGVLIVENDVHSLEDWLALSVDSSHVALTVGDDGSSADLNWDSKAILVFGLNNCGKLLPEHEHFLIPFGMSKDYAFLSNYYMEEITVDGRSYKSSEHYYQAIKFPIGSKIYKSIVKAATPAEAKAIAWANAKDASVGDDQVMSERMKKALWAKFFTANGKPSRLGIKLLATGDAMIIEGNQRFGADGKNNSDRRWGCEFNFTNMPVEFTLEGQNLLGKLLMELRTTMQERVLHKSGR